MFEKRYKTEGKEQVRVYKYICRKDAETWSIFIIGEPEEATAWLRKSKLKYLKRIELSADRDKVEKEVKRKGRFIGEKTFIIDTIFMSLLMTKKEAVDDYREFTNKELNYELCG